MSIPAVFRYCTDACQVCLRATHQRPASMRVLPRALTDQGPDWVHFVYRCGHGHTWGTTLGRDVAVEHSASEQRALVSHV